MHILRKVALGILSPLFIFLLFATAFDVGFIHTATHPAMVKKIVAESGIYDSVLPNLLQQAGTIQTDAGPISASAPDIQKAASAAITPTYIRQNTETVIDSVYAWLDGKTTSPDFKIDLSGVKTNFATNVAAIVQQRLSVLPACTRAQNLTIAQSGFDALNATCLPAGVTPASAASSVQANISGGKEFLDTPVVTADNIGLSGLACNPNSEFAQCTQNKYQNSFFRENPNIPKQYQQAKKTPLILAVLTILTGTGIVFLSSSWQKGLRHIGINLVIVGLVMLLFSWALNRAVSTKIAPKIKVDNAVLQQDVRSLVTDLGQQIDKNYWFFGGIYTVLGAAALAGGYIATRVNSSKSRLDKVDIDLVPHPKK